MRVASSSSVFQHCMLALAAMSLATAELRAQESQADDIQWSVIAPLASKSLLLDGAIIGNFAVVVGERGHVLLSDNKGASWQQVQVPTRATLTGVFFVDQNNGWAVGHDAVIIKTGDGGKSWSRVHFAPQEERPLLDVWFEDASHGIATGAYGYFLETFDGGETWEDRFFEVAKKETTAGDDEADGADEITSAADMMDFLEDEDPIGDLHLNDLRLAPDGTLYLAAEAGHVFKSGDMGETWRSLASPYEGSFYGTLPLGNRALLLFGLRGNLFYSANGGDVWQKLDIGTDAILMGATVTESGDVIVVGLGGALLIARPATAQAPVFALAQQEDRKALATLLSGADGGLILIGEDGVKTIDGELLNAAVTTASDEQP